MGRRYGARGRREHLDCSRVRAHPCPSTGKTSGACPGYRKDHIIPLACGDSDAVLNMQWQTVAEARARDRWERRACGR